MLQNILKSNHPFVIGFIIISAILLWVFSFIEPVGIEIPVDAMSTPFYAFVANLFPLNTFGSGITALILVLIQSLLLVQFNKKYILINSRTYLPAFFYILISGSFIHLQRLNPAIIGTLFIFISIHYIFSIYRSDYALNKLYIAGFFIALASLFWAPLAIIFLLVFISLTILRPLIGREWIAGILGFFTPYLFVLVYYYVFSDQEKLYTIIDTFTGNFSLIKEFYPIHFSYYIFYGFLLLMIILASYTIIINYQKKKIRTRKFFEINWWMFLMGMMLFIFLKNVSYEIIYFLALPTSFLLTDYFYSIRKSWYINGILFILIGAIIYIQIMTHYIL